MHPVLSKLLFDIILLISSQTKATYCASTCLIEIKSILRNLKRERGIHNHLLLIL